jgi:hypothetical protein
MPTVGGEFPAHRQWQPEQPVQMQVRLRTSDDVRPALVDRCASQRHAPPGVGHDLIIAAAADATAIVHDRPPNRVDELTGLRCVHVPDRAAEFPQRHLRNWLGHAVGL